MSLLLEAKKVTPLHHAGSAAGGRGSYPHALEALVELAPEIAAARNSSRLLSVIMDGPSGERIRQQLAVPFGVATADLQPVFFTTNPTRDRSRLVVADPGDGRELLHTTAAALGQVIDSSLANFLVLTAQPDHWDDLQRYSGCAGIHEIGDRKADDEMANLLDWIAHDGSEQKVLLFFDGLEFLPELHYGTQNALQRILREGPERNVFPIVSYDRGSRALDLSSYMQDTPNLFSTIMYQLGDSLQFGIPGPSYHPAYALESNGPFRLTFDLVVPDLA